MKKIFFTIMILLLVCNPGFASEPFAPPALQEVEGSIASSRSDQGWMPYLRKYLPSTRQVLPYALPVAAAGAQALAFPELVRRGYVNPKVARIASFATGIAAPAAANWLQYQQNKENPELANLSYFLPSALMVAVNWVTAGGNIRDLPGMLLQYAYTWPASLVATIRETADTRKDVSELGQVYDKQQREYKDKIGFLSNMTYQLIHNPQLKFGLKIEYENALRIHQDLKSTLSDLEDNGMAGFEELELPRISILGPIIAHFTGSRLLLVNSITMGQILGILRQTINSHRDEIIDILQRGDVYDELMPFVEIMLPPFRVQTAKELELWVQKMKSEVAKKSS